MFFSKEKNIHKFVITLILYIHYDVNVVIIFRQNYMTRLIFDCLIFSVEYYMFRTRVKQQEMQQAGSVIEAICDEGRTATRKGGYIELNRAGNFYLVTGNQRTP